MTAPFYCFRTAETDDKRHALRASAGNINRQAALCSMSSDNVMLT